MRSGVNGPEPRRTQASKPVSVAGLRKKVTLWVRTDYMKFKHTTEAERMSITASERNQKSPGLIGCPDAQIRRMNLYADKLKPDVHSAVTDLQVIYQD